MLERLRSKLQSLEAQNRFRGRPYPKGIDPFPRTLIGQGFFPGGDGLWREDEPAALRSTSKVEFPQHGIMFLGNDFGTVEGFSRLKLHENPPTWRHLRSRLTEAGIDGELGFFTNAYLGLRNDRKALDDGIQQGEYDRMCSEFLSFQISAQRPKLIVILGERPCGLLRSTLSLPPLQQQKVMRCALGQDPMSVIWVSHPYSDLGKSHPEVQMEGRLLREAWDDANR